MSSSNDSNKEVLFALSEIRGAIQLMDSRMHFGLKQVALAPVAVTCIIALSSLLWYKVITEWVWAAFMAAVMFPYFSEGLKYVFDRVPMFKGKIDAATKLIVISLVSFGLMSCVSYTYPLGEDSKYGAITFSAKYNPPLPSIQEILGYNRNIQHTINDK